MRFPGCSFSTRLAHVTRRIFDHPHRMAFAGVLWYRGGHFVTDIEIPFDRWRNYPGVVMPEPLPRPAAG